MATVTVSPTSPRATIDVCTVTVAAAAKNTTGVPETTPTYPPTPFTPQAEAAKRYYLTFEKGGVEKGRSYVFGVDGAGTTGGHVFPGYIFPEAGTFVVRLKDQSNDSTVASSSNVTVS